MLNIRHDFPLLVKPPYQPFCYADTAATSQKPAVVIDAIKQHLQQVNSNVHRGAYRLSEQTSAAYEQARATVAHYFHAPSQGIVFCRSATEALNLLVNGICQKLPAGSGILLSILEHHANIVPWQQAAQRYNLNLHWVKITDQGVIDMVEFATLLRVHPIKVVSLTAVSNVLGTKQPLKELLAQARRMGAITIADCCQYPLREHISLTELNADALVVSSHKMYGPTGVGCLVSTPEFLQELPPYQTGGGMIQYVKQQTSLFLSPPARFEAGTPNIEGAIGFASALNYIQQLDKQAVANTYQGLVVKGLKDFSNLEGYTLLAAGNADRVPTFSLVPDKLHAHDLATYLDRMFGICARAGHHCAMPLHDHLQHAATLRFSFSLYNTLEEIHYCAQALTKAQEFFNV